MYTDHEDVKRIALAAFPEYNGRKFQVNVATSVNVQSYWDGGSRSYYKFVRLHDMFASAEMPPQSMFDKQIGGANAAPLTAGLVCVEHHIFCGKDTGITIHVHPDNAQRYLPPPSDITSDERIVIKYTSSYRNTYGGRTNIRYTEANRETQITPERWASAKASLTEKNFLNKQGALTDAGRNAASERVAS